MMNLSLRFAPAILALALAGDLGLAPPARAADKPAAAPPAQPTPADADAQTYERCMKLAKTDPNAALDLVGLWRSKISSHPADHCAAVALITLRQYKPAAARLQTLSAEMAKAPVGLRADILAQAAQAWLLAGEPKRAYVADTEALELRPNDPDTLVDRAEAAAADERYDKAVEDLDRVLKATPNRVDALIYRASANRSRDRLDPALADVERALLLAPESASGLLERGNILRLKGDDAGARHDWIRVGEIEPDTPADRAAKANLARLDMKDPDKPAPKPK